MMKQKKEKKTSLSRRELRRMAAEEGVELAAKLGFERPLGHRNRSRQSRKYFRTMAAAAAVALLVGSTAYFAAVRYENNLRSAITAQAAPPVDCSTAGDMRTFQTEDGSEITLNAHSALHYDRQSFNRRDRRVKMSNGEAFFKIAPDRQKPFLIDLGAYTVMVLGTSFNISRYRELNQCVVSVLTGKVQILNAAGEAIALLDRDKEIRLDPENNRFTVLDKDCSETAAWTAGKLILNDADGRELKFRIERHFAVSVEVPGNWMSRNIKFRASFPPATSLEEVLLTLKVVYGISYRTDGNRVVLSGGDA